MGPDPDALEAYERECGDTPTLEGVIQAILDADLNVYLSGDEGWRAWGALSGQLSRSEYGAKLMEEYFDPVIRRQVALLKGVMPDTPDENIMWRYHFLTGSLLLVLAQTGRIDRLSDGICRSDDFQAIKMHLARFMAGGFRAQCSQLR